MSDRDDDLTSPSAQTMDQPADPFIAGVAASLDRYIATELHAENDRLEQQALALLVACVPLEDLVLVEQQLDGFRTQRTVTTRDQLDQYIADRKASTR